MNVSLDEIIKSKRIGRGGSARRGQMRRGGATTRGSGATTGRRPQQQQNGAGRFRSERPTAPYKRGNVDDRWAHDMYEDNGEYRTGAARRTSAPGAGAGATKLMISNLDFGVTDADIKELFGEFGPTRTAAVHYDRSGRSLGTAHVLFERRADAVKAVKQYGGVPLDGRAMKLEIATSNVDRPPVASPPAPRRSAPSGGARTRRPDRGPGGAVRGRGARGGGGALRQRAKVPTAEELDAELDAYVSSAK